MLFEVGSISYLKFLPKETKVNFVLHLALVTFGNEVCISVCKMPEIFFYFFPINPKDYYTMYRYFQRQWLASLKKIFLWNEYP